MSRKSLDFTMDDFHTEMPRRGVYRTPREHQTLPPQPSPQHGNTIVRTVSCGVHPLHSVKVRANGSRSGCPMCEMQIESLCRVPTNPPQSSAAPREHAPRISIDRTRITGCTCGWITPPGTTDSDDAYVAHVTHVTVLR